MPITEAGQPDDGWSAGEFPRTRPVRPWTLGWLHRGQGLTLAGMSLPVQLIGFIVLLGGLVFVHELGHFLAAKFFNVKVLKFSIGFGPRVWGFRRGETEYVIAALPLGGFVKMAGESPEAEIAPEDKGRGFAEQSPARRAVIAFAGPLVNLLLPPLVFFGMNLVPQQKEPAVIGVVLPNEPADVAGLRPGDRIVAIDGLPIRSFEEMREAVEPRAHVTVPVVVDRGGERVALTVRPSSVTETNPIETVQKGKLGVIAGKLPSYVGVVPGSRAYEAGLRTFDRITQVNGEPVQTSVELERALEKAGSGPIAFEAVRGQPLDLKTSSISTAEVVTAQVPAGEGPLGFDRADLYLREVRPGSKAWEAGLRPGDRIVSLGGQEVPSGLRFEMLLRDRKVLEMGVLRDGQRRDVIYEPPMVERRDPVQGKVSEPDYGFAFHPRLYVSEPFAPGEMVTVHYGVGEAISRAFATTYDITRGMILGIAGLFTGRVSVESIGGPIMMFQLTGQVGQHGLFEFLKLFVVISINLGLMNLLPIPVLDGFHILVSGVETISRRPVPARVREVANMVGLALLLCLMLLAMKNDIVRSFAQ